MFRFRNEWGHLTRVGGRDARPALGVKMRDNTMPAIAYYRRVPPLLGVGKVSPDTHLPNLRVANTFIVA